GRYAPHLRAQADLAVDERCQTPQLELCTLPYLRIGGFRVEEVSQIVLQLFNEVVKHAEDELPWILAEERLGRLPYDSVCVRLVVIDRVKVRRERVGRRKLPQRRLEIGESESVERRQLFGDLVPGGAIGRRLLLELAPPSEFGDRSVISGKRGVVL